MIKATQASLDILRKIEETVHAPHEHNHLLYDIAKSYPDDYLLEYVELGCLEGASSCLMLQRTNTNVTTIDIGDPIHPDKVMENIKKYNVYGNNFRYLRGYTQDPTTIDALKTVTPAIDILFIDADHSYEAVFNDFHAYNPLVKKGGYVVFDDYGHSDCPDVIRAVTAVLGVPGRLNYFDPIGRQENILGAGSRTLDNTMNNCFVLRKL